MSSKQLESILGRVTSATPKPHPRVPEPAAPPPTAESAVVTLPVTADKKTKPARTPAPQPRKAEPERAIQAYVPVSIAKALNMRAAQEDVTVRTLILQGLKAIGFDVPEEDLRDRRK